MSVHRIVGKGIIFDGSPHGLTVKYELLKIDWSSLYLSIVAYGPTSSKKEIKSLSRSFNSSYESNKYIEKLRRSPGLVFSTLKN